jgi:hypothetical protein
VSVVSLKDLDAPHVGDTIGLESETEAVVTMRERDKDGNVWIGYQCTKSAVAHIHVGFRWPRFPWSPNDHAIDHVSRSWRILKLGEWRPSIAGDEKDLFGGLTCR